MAVLAKHLWMCSCLVLVQLLLLTIFVVESDGANWQLKWSPTADANGLGQGMGAFEGIEDDRAHSDPGVKHIFVEGDHYRFNMPLKERDSSPDRQRNEVKGMRDTSGNIISILKGETWRLEHSLYIPSTLKATTSFTHIMQFKKPGPGSSPILTIDLHKSDEDSQPVIQLQLYATGTILGSAPLQPLQDSWIHSSITFTADNNVSIQWVLTDSSNATVVNAQGENQDLWLAERVRPKWGIYRSVKDTADLEDCSMFIKHLQAWQMA